MAELVNAKARIIEQTYQLKSLPGGWVKVRRFTHGERKARLDHILSYHSGGEDEGGMAKISQAIGAQYDFEHAIVDHNLGDGDRKYDFTKKADVWALDPEVGDEITDIINVHQEVIPETELPKSEASFSDTTSG